MAETTLTSQQIVALPEDHPKLRDYKYDDEGNVLDPPRIGSAELALQEAALSGDNDAVARVMSQYHAAREHMAEEHNDLAGNLRETRERHYSAVAGDLGTGDKQRDDDDDEDTPTPARRGRNR